MLSEISFREQSQKITAQFDVAINNMSHGLCTLDGEGRIVIFNNKFRSVLSLPPEAPLAGCDIYALLSEVIPNLVTHAQYLQGGSDTTMNVETHDGRTIELTIHSMDDEGSVLVVQDVTDRFNAERRIQYMAHFDAVTGLPNRHAFETTLAESLAQWRPDHQALTILFLDLDNFKQINDSLGHRTGDKVLVESAERLRRVIEPNDFISRWGGDEFIILHFCDLSAPTDGHKYTKRIIEEVRRPLVIDGSEVIVGVSIGSATAFSAGVTADVLLSNADMALYAAKADGRGCWRTFEPEMDTRIQTRRLLELELRNAVSNKDITVDFQPIVNVATGRIAAFEALARWRSPTKGPVAPSAFIPILEETGLIYEVGGMILRRACAACARWPDDIAVSVNLSAIQFREDHLNTTIIEALWPQDLIQIGSSLKSQNSNSVRRSYWRPQDPRLASKPRHSGFPGRFRNWLFQLRPSPQLPVRPHQNRPLVHSGPRTQADVVGSGRVRSPTWVAGSVNPLSRRGSKPSRN